MLKVHRQASPADLSEGMVSSATLAKSAESRVQYYYSCGISNYKAHPVGLPSIPKAQQERLKRKGNFVLIGTSGLTNLVIACSCTASIEENVSLDLIPKLFIIDNSVYVQQFWQLMKEIVKDCETLDDLNNALEDNKDKLIECCNPWYLNYDKSILPFIKKIIDNNKTDQPDSGQLIFTYLMKIIEKATFVCDDMQSELVFNYIKQMNKEKNLPIIFYASNVIEFIGTEQYNFLEHIQKTNERQKQIEKIQNIVCNIATLSPEFVIHLRTTKERSAELCLTGGKDPIKDIVLNPDTLLLLSKEDNEPTQSLELLINNKYIPIVINPVTIAINFAAKLLN